MKSTTGIYVCDKNISAVMICEQLWPERSKLLGKYTIKWFQAFWQSQLVRHKNRYEEQVLYKGVLIAVRISSIR